MDFLQAVIFAGVVTLVARLFKGKDAFEGQFSLYDIAFVPASILFADENQVPVMHAALSILTMKELPF